MNNNYDDLLEIATKAYTGWAVGWDIVNPMHNLRRELISRGVDVDAIVTNEREHAKRKYEQSYWKS